MSLKHKYLGVSGRAATAAVRRRLKKKAYRWMRRTTLRGKAKKEQCKKTIKVRFFKRQWSSIFLAQFGYADLAE